MDAQIPQLENKTQAIELAESIIGRLDPYCKRPGEYAGPNPSDRCRKNEAMICGKADGRYPRRRELILVNNSLIWDPRARRLAGRKVSPAERGGAVFRHPYVLLTDRECDGIRRRWRRFRENGRRWTPRYCVNNWLTHFKRHVRRAGVIPDGRLSLHELRKGCIQNSADLLPMNVTQEFAGHADPETTQKFYTQVDDHHRSKAAHGIDRLLAKSDAKLTPEAKLGGKLA